MKKSIKNIVLALCTASVILTSVTALASSTTDSARRTKTVSATDVTTASSTTNTSDTASDNSEQSDEASNTTAGAAASGVTQDSSRPIPTAISTGQDQQTNVVQNTEAQKAAEKKYASKGSIALWFILSIIINAILSFMIGNRFYKLGRKESHVTSEIRALRRDLEEKFVGNVGGFTEMETDVTNSNDNYSTNGSINMPDRKSTDFAAESEDVFKKWESRMTPPSRAKAVVEEEPAEAFEEDEQPKRRFRPSREAEVYTDDEELFEDDDTEDSSKLKSVKDKAKNILGDIFPFKED